METDIIVGIDLGTTYSCIGIYKNGKVEILTNDQGDRTTPSYVAFTDEQRIIGKLAKSQASYNALNTIYDSKRLIGRLFNDKILQDDQKLWPFVLSSAENGKPLINVEYKNEQKQFYPEQISAMILEYLKNIAETTLGHKVKRAIITVPAYFTDAQRRATKDAGEIAGLIVERIINEPTAAALAYGLDKLTDERNVLIFDLGGGTLDVSLLELDNGMFQVKATNGNTHLGGQDFDNNLIKYIITDFCKKNKQYSVNEIHKNKKTLSKLRTISESIKKELSTLITTKTMIESLYDGVDHQFTISRTKFEEICEQDFDKCMEPIYQVLKDASMNKHEVTDIVLVGGSSRIPKIRDLLYEYFGKEPKQDINPDEAVAYGAAIHGAMINNVQDEKIDTMVLLDVTPLTLGIEISGGLMSKIIPRNATIPTCKEQKYSTYSDNQPGVTVKIYEGEREFTKDNNLLGTFELKDLPLKPKGVPQIIVKFELDVNGILNVSATEESSGKSNKILIKNDKNRFSFNDLHNMISDAEKFANDDLLIRKKIEAKSDLETFIYYWQRQTSIETFKTKLGQKNMTTLIQLLNDTVEKLELDLDTQNYIDIKKDIDDTIKQMMTEKKVDSIGRDKFGRI